MSPILGIWASQNYSRYSITGSYDSIATVSVGSGGAVNVEFTSIPATFTHLQIRAIAKASGTNFNPKMQFNNDTATNYSWHYIYGDGSTVAAGAGATQAFIYNSIISTNASMYNGFVIDILDYANSNKYKTLRCFGGFDANGSGQIILTSNLWMSTSAITSVSFALEANSFVQYSQFALYGIRSA